MLESQPPSAAPEISAATSGVETASAAGKCRYKICMKTQGDISPKRGNNTGLSQEVLGEAGRLAAAHRAVGLRPSSLKESGFGDK